MAEGFLKKYLKDLGKDSIKVSSAGIGAAEGFGPTNETIEVMKKEAIDVSNYKSKRLTNEMIKNSDLILTMEEMHREEIVKRVPGTDSKTHLFKKFGRSDKEYHPEGFSVPDPIGRPLKDYEFCLGMIKEDVRRIAGIL